MRCHVVSHCYRCLVRRWRVTKLLSLVGTIDLSRLKSAARQHVRGGAAARRDALVLRPQFAVNDSRQCRRPVPVSCPSRNRRRRMLWRFAGSIDKATPERRCPHSGRILSSCGQRCSVRHAVRWWPFIWSTTRAGDRTPRTPWRLFRGGALFSSTSPHFAASRRSRAIATLILSLTSAVTMARFRLPDSCPADVCASYVASENLTNNRL